jgi:hypothetical protein
MIKWKQIKWPYNDDAPYCDWECWKASIKGRKVILHPGMWPDKGWSYVVQGEYSGFLKGFTELESAKKELEKKTFA